MAQGGQAGANAADVPHLGQLHGRLAVELVEDRRPALEALGDVDSAGDLGLLGANVVAQVRGDPRQGPSVQASPPSDCHHRVDQLVEIEAGVVVLPLFRRWPQVEASQELTGSIHLPVRVNGVGRWLEGVWLAQHQPIVWATR